MSQNSHFSESNTTYRSISIWAVASLILGGMTVAGFLIPALTSLALPSVATAMVALWSIHHYELGGRRIAILGIALSVMLAVVIPTWHIERFRAEAPAGTVRLDFSEVASTKNNVVGLEKYEGQRVCLKGYVFPTDRQIGITSFLMSSNGVFGSESGMIGVLLASPQTWTWSYGGQAVTGTLVPNPDFVEGDEEIKSKWILRDSEVRPALSPVQLAYSRRSTRGC